MPTYDYRCAKCGEELEVFQTFAEAPLTKHKGCGGKLAKVLSPAGIVLKGSGFYKTDNRSSSSKRSAARGQRTRPASATPATRLEVGLRHEASRAAKSSSDSGSGSSGSSEQEVGIGLRARARRPTKKPAAKSA